MSMNPEVKAKWVAALRSGEYRQARGQLRTTDNAFCCLGVLCNLHAQEHPEIAQNQTRPTSYMGASQVLADAVAEWAGLRWWGNEEVRIGGKKRALPAHNDQGCTFEEIAKAIEEQL